MEYGRVEKERREAEDIINKGYHAGIDEYGSHYVGKLVEKGDAIILGGRYGPRNAKIEWLAMHISAPWGGWVAAVIAFIGIFF